MKKGRKSVDPNEQPDKVVILVTKTQGRWLRERAHMRRKSIASVMRLLVDQAMEIERILKEEEKRNGSERFAGRQRLGVLEP